MSVLLFIEVRITPKAEHVKVFSRWRVPRQSEAATALFVWSSAFRRIWSLIEDRLMAELRTGALR
jgi:hypothetical protein